MFNQGILQIRKRDILMYIVIFSFMISYGIWPKQKKILVRLSIQFLSLTLCRFRNPLKKGYIV
jgi:hypothetical protein